MSRYSKKLQIIYKTNIFYSTVFAMVYHGNLQNDTIKKVWKCHGPSFWQ